MEKIKEARMKYALSELYKKACREQIKIDPRIVSPDMKNIQELREWYFKEANHEQAKR